MRRSRYRPFSLQLHRIGGFGQAIQGQAENPYPDQISKFINQYVVSVSIEMFPYLQGEVSMSLPRLNPAEGCYGKEYSIKRRTGMNP